ncbi:hypothetical protein EJ04DRAFT_555276 [Polyplosphaeria fusca]|uniref:Azaphilone pigments biosynthesis cluster protein L N-terminal domain-containing protein n=1 Tax=Polyplosphaeria fusca TaxID=682080 RepID=A0A9P4QND2_9PLEO|nr:hypothetical protein EJ04DRAFT_555276 [Polyplosphaeria fusca]
MDRLSGGAAAVLAFITIALQYTKIIYKTFGGIKDGPRYIRDLRSCAQALGLVLEQLSRSSALQPGCHEHDVKPLAASIKQCLFDVATIEEKIQKLQPPQAKGRWTITWKRTSLMLKKDDFEDMWKTLCRHICALGLHVQILSTEIDISNHNSALSRIGEYLYFAQAQGSALARVDSTLQNLGDAAEDSLYAKKNAHLHLSNTISQSHYAQNMSIKALLDQIRKDQEIALKQIGSRLANVPDLSLQQFITLRQILQDMNELQKEVAELRKSKDCKRTFHYIRNLDQKPVSGAVEKPQPFEQHLGAEEELVHVICRLANFVERKQGLQDPTEAQLALDDLQSLLDAGINLHDIRDDAFSSSSPSDEAQSVIHDLENLLVSGRRQLHGCKIHLNDAKKRKIDASVEDNAGHRRNLKRGRAMLGSSWDLDINHSPTKRS